MTTNWELILLQFQFGRGGLRDADGEHIGEAWRLRLLCAQRLFRACILPWVCRRNGRGNVTVLIYRKFSYLIHRCEGDGRRTLALGVNGGDGIISCVEMILVTPLIVGSDLKGNTRLW